MAKNTFLDWSTTAASNTDVGGIGILGVNAVNNFDDALRTIMAQLRSGVDGEVVYAAKNAGYTAVANDNNAVHRFTSSATVALTAAATLGANWHYTVVADGGAITIDPNASETINGQATLTVPNGLTAQIICDGSNFFTVIKPMAWEAIGIFGLAGASTLDVTNLGGFRKLRISGSFTTSVNSGVGIRTSTDNGSTFDSGASDYTTQSLTATGTTVTASTSVGTQASISALLAVDSTTQFAFELLMENFNSSGSVCRMMSRAQLVSVSTFYLGQAGLARTSSVARNAFRIFPSAGGTMSGFVIVEGVRG